ncbi:MAG: glycosyltransferase family A protein [Proteobacteria bacterium]|nr:glycosyltransferase family A protein [Pseudomonadota bacterium]
MTAPPRVTVLMPAHDREAYVGQAVESVLAQTFQNFELLVVDDASSDRTAEVVAAYARSDPRLRLVRNEANLGIPETRSRGVKLARGELIAFLDDDDRARPRRLARQLAHLDRNPSCAAVGGWARRMDAQGRAGALIRRPTGPDRVRARMLFAASFKNTTMMARRELVLKYGFRSEFPLSQDSDLWTRMALDHPVDNLPQVLCDYRVHAGSVRRGRGRLRRRLKRAIAAYQLENLGVPFDASDLRRHYRLRKPLRARAGRETLRWASAWLAQLCEANRQRRLYPEPAFGRTAGEIWWQLCWGSRLSRGEAARFFLDSELRAAAGASLLRAPLLLRDELRARASGGSR